MKASEMIQAASLHFSTEPASNTHFRKSAAFPLFFLVKADKHNPPHSPPRRRKGDHVSSLLGGWPASALWPLSPFLKRTYLQCCRLLYPQPQQQTSVNDLLVTVTSR